MTRRQGEMGEGSSPSGFTPASEMVPGDFREIERRDEDQIIAEIQGQVIEEMFYQFRVKGRAKPVTGISWVGTKEIARNYGHIETEFVELEDLGEEYFAVVRATDRRRGVSLVGTSRQAKQMRLKTGELRDDKFAIQKAVSKAQRNAIRAVIPEEFLKKAYQAWQDRGKPPIRQAPPKRNKSKPKQVEVEAEAGPTQRLATDRQRQAIHKFGVKTLPEKLSREEASNILEELIGYSREKDRESLNNSVRDLNRKWQKTEKEKEKGTEAEAEAVELTQEGEDAVFDIQSINKSLSRQEVLARGRKFMEENNISSLSQALQELDLQMKSFTGAPQPDGGGGERTPIQVVREALEPLVNPDDLDFVEQGGALQVMPMRPLGDTWEEITAALERQFDGEWISEGKKSRWEISTSLPEEDE